MLDQVSLGLREDGEVDLLAVAKRIHVRVMYQDAAEIHSCVAEAEQSLQLLVWINLQKEKETFIRHYPYSITLMLIAQPWNEIDNLKSGIIILRIWKLFATKLLF